MYWSSGRVQRVHTGCWRCTTHPAATVSDKCPRSGSYLCSSQKQFLGNPEKCLIANPRCAATASSWVRQNVVETQMEHDSLFAMPRLPDVAGLHVASRWSQIPARAARFSPPEFRKTPKALPLLGGGCPCDLPMPMAMAPQLLTGGSSDALLHLTLAPLTSLSLASLAPLSSPVLTSDASASDCLRAMTPLQSRCFLTQQVAFGSRALDLSGTSERMLSVHLCDSSKASIQLLPEAKASSPSEHLQSPMPQDQVQHLDCLCSGPGSALPLLCRIAHPVRSRPKLRILPNAIISHTSAVR